MRLMPDVLLTAEKRMNRECTAIVREVRRTLWNSMNTVFIKLRKMKILVRKKL